MTGSPIEGPRQRGISVGEILSDRGMDLLYREARTHKHWQDKDVSDVLLEAIYDLAKMGPTSANCCPLRVIYLRSADAKARLKPTLDKGNVGKTMAAPVTAIIAYDMNFHEQMTILNPLVDAQAWFGGNDDLILETAVRNGSLQGGYFILAARALGLDCGPMSGFDNAAVDREFLAGSAWRSNILCNLGFGDPDKLHPRHPRLPFDDVCRIE